MTRLSVLKAEHSHRLSVGYQHYGQLMIENFFDIYIFFDLKNDKLYIISQLVTNVKDALW